MERQERVLGWRKPVYNKCEVILGQGGRKRWKQFSCNVAKLGGDQPAEGTELQGSVGRSSEGSAGRLHRTGRGAMAADRGTQDSRRGLWWATLAPKDERDQREEEEEEQGRRAAGVLRSGRPHAPLLWAKGRERAVSDRSGGVSKPSGFGGTCSCWPCVGESRGKLQVRRIAQTGKEAWQHAHGRM